MALRAGADLLLGPRELPMAFNAVVRAVRDGDLREGRIDESAERILRLKERLGLLDESFVKVHAAEPSLGTDEHGDVAAAVGRSSVTVLSDRDGWLPLRKGWDVFLTGPRPEGAGSIAGNLREAGHEVTAAWTGTRPNRKQIRRAERAAERHDVTILVTSHLGPNRTQRDLARRLSATGRRIVVVFGSSPYDVTWLLEAPAQVATYSTSPVSMRGLARVLTGEIPAMGQLPVRIPGPGGGTLYAFGHGRTPGR